MLRRGCAGWSVALLGMGAALLAHEVLQGIAALRLGAHTFAEHEHTAVGPALVIEIFLGLCLLFAAVRDMLGNVPSPKPGRASPARPSRASIALAGIAIALMAAATLFGMEFAESPATALGLGWIGGTLFPGTLVLAASAAAATWLLYATLCGKIAGLQRLAELCASALARLFGSIGRRVATSRPIHRTPALGARTAPSSHHGGLRAPPTLR